MHSQKDKSTDHREYYYNDNHIFNKIKCERKKQVRLFLNENKAHEFPPKPYSQF